MDNINSKQINWFPGHMAKTRRLMGENLKLVDAVIEVTDARIPYSSRNPEMDSWVGGKPRIVLLNKCDTADEKLTAEWIEYYKSKGIYAMTTDCKSGKNVNNVITLARSVLKETIEKWAQKGMVGRPIRLMIVGIPNVGKSSLINRLAGAKKANVEDRPGVTRGKQWVAISNGVELLDMPGVLWPKFEDQTVGENLALTGAVKDDVLDLEALACALISRLVVVKPECILERYKVNITEDMDSYDILCGIGRKRGFLVSGGEINTERTAIMLVDEYRSGKLGKITLEKPEK